MTVMAVVALTPSLSTVIWVVPGLRALTVPVTGSIRATRGSLDDQRWEAGSAMGKVTVARLSPPMLVPVAVIVSPVPTESCPQKTPAWQDHLWWQGQDRKTLRRINTLIKDRPQRAMGRTEDLRRSCP
jgi:hypothetical protein